MKQTPRKDYWTKDDLLIQCCLDAGLPVPDGGISTLSLRAPAVDPRTGGALNVVSTPVFDDDGYLKSLSISAWRRLPDGNAVSQEIISLSMQPTDDDQAVFDKMTVQGRDVPVTHLPNVQRVLEAVRRIHLDLREYRLPPVRQIFNECHIEDVTGESLPLIGFGADGGFDFSATAQSGPVSVPAGSALTLPRDFVEGMVGVDGDDLSSHWHLRGKKRRTAVQAKSAVAFASDIRVDQTGDTLRTHVGIKPIVTPHGGAAQSIPDMIDAFWRATEPGLYQLEKLVLLGEEIPAASDKRTMQALGVVGKAIEAFRRHDYPAFMDYLAEFDLLDLCYPLSPPPAAADGGRGIVIAVSGHNFEEITDDFGASIGGNLHLIFHEILTADGKIDRVGACHDIGLFIKSKPAEWNSAAPDIIDFIDDVDHFFVTHRHLDHTDGIIPYAAENMLKGKMFYGSPEVIYMLKKKLREAEVDKAKWPDFCELRGKGWVHIKDKDGVKRISVQYSVDGTEHSARDTAYRYIMRYGDIIKGSYHNRGDERCGRHYDDNYVGPMPDRLNLDKDFLASGLRDLMAEEPQIDPAILDRDDTYTEFDLTNYQKHGDEPTEDECMERQLRIMKWFDDKGIIFAQISTNDNKFESGLRVATHLQRNITEVGAAVEKTAQMFNKLGVNRNLVDPVERNNINHYLKWYAAKLSEPRIAPLLEQLRAEQAKSEGERDHKRIKAIQKQIRDETLPAVTRKGRTSNWSKALFEGDPSQRFVYVTGTQGNWAELETTLNKLAEGRSMMDLDPNDRPAARPIEVDENVIFISQGTIPGNREYRDVLVHKLVRERGYTVVEAEHDSTIFHNLREPKRTQILAEFKADGIFYDERPDGSVIVSPYCIHAPGHAYKEGVNRIRRMNHPDVAGGQHTDDLKTAAEFIREAENEGQRTPGKVFHNGAVIEVDMQGSKEAAKVEQIGKIASSIILMKVMRKFKQYFGGYIEAKRVIVADRDMGLRQDGLMSRKGGVYSSHFSHISLDSRKRGPTRARATGLEPALTGRMEPPRRRRYQGARFPVIDAGVA